MFKKRKFVRKARLLDFIDSLPGVLYQYQEWPDGRCVFPYSTPAIEAILFATPVELAADGQIAWNKLDATTAITLQNAYRQSAESLHELLITFPIQSMQDRTHWIRNRAVPKRLRDGSTLWHGYMENITKQHQEAETARQKAALLHVIFETLPDQIYYMDRESRILGVNPACCEHHKKTAEEMIGKTDLDLYPAGLGEKLLRDEQKIITTGEPVRILEKHRATDGSLIHLESFKTPLRDPSGEIIGLAGISRDISRQVDRETELQEARRKAEQDASFIHALFDNLEDQFYYKDRESKVLGGNKAWVKVRGAASIDALIGKTDLDFHPAPLGRQLYDNEQRQMETGEVTRIRERHVRPDGKIEYIESVKCPMRNDRGEVIGLAGISRDITRQVENERVLVQAQQEAEAANKAKSAFLAMMSHEIRTPMNGVIGAASLLLGTRLTADQEEFVRTIQISGENLLTIINDILDYSKIEAGKIELEKEPFNLRECIEDSFDLFAQIAARKNIELLYYIDPSIPAMFTGDSTRLRQILVNLVGNAVKFTENGEIRLNIHKILEDETLQTCRLEFSVKDTGIGIADEHKERLFQAFSQVDSSSTRRYGGTGLGLVISRRLTELMGGTIWFESQEGKGSVFSFSVELPVCRKEEHRTHPLPVEALRGKRALIVDDNDTNRWLLSDQLAQWGILSEAFASPEDALSHLQDGPPYDIALIDFQMPEMDGKELARRIYRLERPVPLPVLILSSSFEHIEPDPAITARLSKPVRINKLRDQILDALSDEKTQALRTATPNGAVNPRKKIDLKILVAEDNPINQRIIQLMLQQLGCENPVIVADGEAAVAAVMDAPFDLILMDVQMPHMNGLEATRRIRELTGSATSPEILALSAGVMQEEQAAALEAGMNGFLAKPLNIDQLRERLNPIQRG